MTQYKCNTHTHIGEKSSEERRLTPRRIVDLSIVAHTTKKKLNNDSLLSIAPGIFREIISMRWMPMILMIRYTAGMICD